MIIVTELCLYPIIIQNHTLLKQVKVNTLANYNEENKTKQNKTLKRCTLATGDRMTSRMTIPIGKDRPVGGLRAG